MCLPSFQAAMRRLVISVGVCFIATLSWIAGCVILPNLPFGGEGTVYSKNYDEKKFRSLRVGMTAKEVESIMGEPLTKVPLRVSRGFTMENNGFIVINLTRPLISGGGG